MSIKDQIKENQENKKKISNARIKYSQKLQEIEKDQKLKIYIGPVQTLIKALKKDNLNVELYLKNFLKKIEHTAPEKYSQLNKYINHCIKLEKLEKFGTPDEIKKYIDETSHSREQPKPIELVNCTQEMPGEVGTHKIDTIIDSKDNLSPQLSDKNSLQEKTQPKYTNDSFTPTTWYQRLYYWFMRLINKEYKIPDQFNHEKRSKAIDTIQSPKGTLYNDKPFQAIDCIIPTNSVISPISITDNSVSAHNQQHTNHTSSVQLQPQVGLEYSPSCIHLSR